jgi:diadenosine tetraphosphatase ApaH/serine/threonine PP2A family protein phosphatase
VNPGSLGQPKTGKPDACYAVWEDGKFQLKQFAYPVERAVQRIEQLPVPPDVRRDLATVLRTGSV